MSIQEKFDNIIHTVEELLKEDMSCDNGELAKRIATKVGMNSRALGDAFQFITETTFVAYIRQRKMVRALELHILNNKRIEESAEVIGFSDAAAFSKACKKLFGVSPSQITPEMLRKYNPLYFQQVCTTEYSKKGEDDAMIMVEKHNRQFDISSEQFAEVKEVIELGALYGFTDEEAETVYRLSKQIEMPLAKAAEIYDDYRLQLENGSAVEGEDYFAPAELAATYNLSYSESKEILYELEANGYDGMHSVPKYYFDIYFSKENEQFWGFSVGYICEMAEAMEQHGLSADDLDDIFDLAEFFEEDPIVIIEDIDGFANERADLVENVLETGDICSFVDDTDGFGYRSIWELPEEER